ncbi:MAG: 1-deoxy-D-xylulose-5-phosphate synthase [Candidatus Zixiibacteriota bacterium]
MREIDPQFALLATVNTPADLKRLTLEELQQLCAEIRHYIIDVIGAVGGHFASSLGAVELSVALHHLYDAPRDKIVWDVGHQAYVHKILTGRRDLLPTIRRFEGISGFLRRDESPYDAFGAGHASTSISAALGMAIARDRHREDYRVVAVIGDGGMTGGLAYEGLNNAGASGTDITVILNDNRMSISPNVGAISRYLAEIIADPRLNQIRRDIWAALGKAPFHNRLQSLARRVDESLKTFIAPGMLFEDLGFKYIGPIDGHNLADILPVLRRAKELRRPVLVHLITRKGCGHSSAEKDPVAWHGVKARPAQPAPTATAAETTRPITVVPPYTDVFGQVMLQLAERDPRVVAITAAMATGTGLVPFSERFPDRFFDVGIAEGHAVTFAAGLAAAGFRPVCAIYSTFLQRAFDHLVHDVALQKLPVVFCLDRGGLAGEDGPTHHGNLDIAYLSCVPGMTVAAPKDGNELRDLLFSALAWSDGPFAIRYPKDTAWRFDSNERYRPLPIGEWEVLQEGSDLCLLAVGAMVRTALDVAGRLAAAGINTEVVNARFVKPLDTVMLGRIAAVHQCIVTIEEANRRGGFGQAVAQEFASRPQRPAVHTIAVEDCLVPHGARPILLDWAGLSAARIEKRIHAILVANPVETPIITSRRTVSARVNGRRQR